MKQQELQRILRAVASSYFQARASDGSIPVCLRSARAQKEKIVVRQDDGTIGISGN